MKTYKEIAAALFDRRDAYYARRAKRQKTALAVVSGVCCVGLAVLLGFGLRQDAGTIPAAGSSEGTVTAPDTPSAVSDGYGAADTGNGIMQRPGEDSTVSYIPMISAYEGEGASYMSPENGRVHRSIPLSGAMNAYGDSVRYNVRIDVFRDQQLLAADSAEVRSEIERLAALGYTTVFQTYDDGTSEHYTFSCHATREQLLAFPANAEYGYFLYLYDERD